MIKPNSQPFAARLKSGPDTKQSFFNTLNSRFYGQEDMARKKVLLAAKADVFSFGYVRAEARTLQKLKFFSSLQGRALIQSTIASDP